MNVIWALMHVIRMLDVTTPLGLISVNAVWDTLVMDSLAVVWKLLTEVATNNGNMTNFVSRYQ